jgi:hypothetical protein
LVKKKLHNRKIGLWSQKKADIMKEDQAYLLVEFVAGLHEAIRRHWLI